jgi:hypothetical protein
MPKGPKGQKRPAGVIANAVQVMRIATGEAEEPPDTRNQAAVALSRTAHLKAVGLALRHYPEAGPIGAKGATSLVLR